VGIIKNSVPIIWR